MKLRTRKHIVTVEVDGITVEGRIPTPAETEKITKKHTKYRGAGAARRAETDTYAVNRDIFNLMVINWSVGDGLPVDEDGNELQCTKENKDKVREYDIQWCAEVVAAINQASYDRTDALEKN